MEILFEAVVMLASAALGVFVCHYLRVSPLAAFLLTGIVIGPHGLSIIYSHSDVEVLAEVGVVLLLFSIGLEFSIDRLLAVKRIALLGGGAQILFTVLLVLPLAAFFWSGTGALIFVGLLVSLSSTAIVLRYIQGRGEMEAPYGRIAMSVLIFQDIAAVPMVLAAPVMAGAGRDALWDLALLFGKAAAIVTLVILLARRAVPWLLYLIARTRNSELFLLSTVVICFAVAWLTHAVGLSLALGAFLAGLVVSESEYSHQAVANILPFRDLFTSFFFLSIGMLLDLHFVANHLLLVLGAAVVAMAVKAIAAGGAALLLGFSVQTSLLSALFLCQIGEFAFVLYQAGDDYGILTAATAQVFLSVSVLSMLAAPFIMGAAPGLVRYLGRVMPRALSAGLYKTPEEAGGGIKEKLRSHLIIVGYGLTGRHLAEAAATWKVPFLVVDYNPMTVRDESRKGTPILYGDASTAHVLEQAGIESARVMAVAVPDPVFVRRITKAARDLNPSLHLVVRTRFVGDVEELAALGADEVVVEEYETSIEIFSRVLARYQVPRTEIEDYVGSVRESGYSMFRSLPEDKVALCEFVLPAAFLEKAPVAAGSAADGKTLGELALRKKLGVSVLAVRRDGEIISAPGADTRLAAGDSLALAGERRAVAEARKLFRA